MYRVATAPTLVVAEIMNMMIIWYRAACIITFRVVRIIVKFCKCFYRTDEEPACPLCQPKLSICIAESEFGNAQNCLILSNPILLCYGTSKVYMQQEALIALSLQ